MDPLSECVGYSQRVKVFLLISIRVIQRQICRRLHSTVPRSRNCPFLKSMTILCRHIAQFFINHMQAVRWPANQWILTCRSLANKRKTKGAKTFPCFIDVGHQSIKYRLLHVNRHLQVVYMEFEEGQLKAKRELIWLGRLPPLQFRLTRPWAGTVTTSNISSIRLHRLATLLSISD